MTLSTNYQSFSTRFKQNDRKILCFDLKSECSLLCGKVKKSDGRVQQIFVVVFKSKK